MSSDLPWARGPQRLLLGLDELCLRVVVELLGPRERLSVSGTFGGALVTLLLANIILHHTPFALSM